MNTLQIPAAENVLSKKDNNIAKVNHSSCQCYFRPETGDVIFLSEADAGEFDDLSNKLSRLMDQLEGARKKFSESLEKYYKKRNEIINREQLDAYFNAVVLAELKVEKATRAIGEEIGEFNEQSGYANLVELIPLEPLKKGVYGRFYCYLKKSDYEAFYSRLTIFNLKKFGAEEFYQRNEKGDITGINTTEIIKRFKKIKASLEAMASGDNRLSGEINYEKNLTEWADAWNDMDAYTMEGKVIDVSAGAQFLRFSANAGALAAWNLSERSGRISGEAQSTLALAASQAKATFYQPDRGGWQLKFIINDRGKEANLGVLRSKIDVTLTGFAGASAKIEGNLQFVLCDGQQRIMGLRAPSTSFIQRQKGALVDTKKKPSANAEVGAELFGGAKLGGTFGGALQWLKPFDLLVDALPDILKTFGLQAGIADKEVLDKVVEAGSPSAATAAGKGEFTDFAAFAAGGEGQVGGGFSGDFQFKFENGKFKFLISAGVCLGLGGKGTAQGEVNPAQFREFAAWAIYQLYGMDYKHFKVFAKDAFMALTYILLMGGGSVYKNYYKEMKADIDVVLQDFKGFAEKISSKVNNAMDASSQRNSLADSINKKSFDVYYFTPEGKGIALYLLVEQGIYDQIDTDNYRLASLIDNTENGWFPFPDAGHERKKAVLIILSSIQTKREWVEVLVRMTPDGTEITGSAAGKIAQEKLVRQQEQTIRTFLQTGLNQDKQLDELIRRLDLRDFREVYQRLKNKPAFGYPFAPNCSKRYALHCDDNPWYTSLCHMLPEDPTIKHRLEPTKK